MNLIYVSIGLINDHYSKTEGQFILKLKYKEDSPITLWFVSINTLTFPQGH